MRGGFAFWEGVRVKGLEYKWIVATVFAFGMFMSLLDMTVVNVAIPTFAGDFKADTTTVQWVITAYLLSLAVFIPVSGWAGDRFGTKRTFMFALAVFTLGSLSCALAWNIHALIAARVIQGVGGGLLTPVGAAMLFRVFAPSERAQAGAVISIPAAVAPATGPVLGGYLVEYQSWHWIFLINIPIGVVALIVAGLFLREAKQAAPGRLDVPGFLLSASGLAILLYALAEAGTHRLDDPRVVAFALVGIALLAIFAVVELRTKEPLIDMRLFRDKLFRAVNIMWLPAQAAFIGVLFLLPLLLQLEMGLTPLESGLTTFPMAIGVGLIAQPVGRIYRHVGPRRLLLIGMTGLLLSTLAFLLVDLQTNLWWIRLIMFARGCSFGFIMVPAQAAAYVTIRPQDTGRATAIGSAVPQVAASFGVALIATVLSDRLTHHGAAIIGTPTRALPAFHDAFLVTSMLPILAFVAILFISDKAALAAARRTPPSFGAAPVAETSADGSS
jgi:EmrB/QacA subfamily drug resistance transporter